MRIIYNSQKGSKGIELEKLLYDQNFRLDTFNTRMFYIISPNSEPEVFKIGIAGLDGKPLKRLRDYELYYGKNVKGNDCLGARVHLIGVSQYNPLVETRKSEIAKLENSIKQWIQRNKRYKSRGRERTNVNLQKLKQMVLDKNFKDEETELRRSKRLQFVG